MSKLKLVQIYVDEEDWKKLEDKVGKRQRSMFIRQQIAEKVADPDTEEGISIEQDMLLKRFNNLEYLKNTMAEEREENIKELNKKYDSVESAEDLISSILEENKKIVKRSHYDQDGNRETIEVMERSISDDEIKDIANTYQVPYKELCEFTKAQEHAKIHTNTKTKIESHEYDIRKKQQFNAEE